MAHYLVSAEPRFDTLPKLRGKLDRGAVEELEPFGRTLQHALEEAKLDPAETRAYWEEEDYCTPPLKAEREAVLDEHFSDIRVEPVERGQGWQRIENLPTLWEAAARTSGA